MKGKVGGQLQLPGTDVKGDYQASSLLADAMRSRGIDPESFASVRADPDKMVEMGTSVRDQMKTDKPTSSGLQASYAALRDDVNEQYDYLTRPTEKGGLGVAVNFSAEDTYDTPWALRDDIDNNRSMSVLDTNAHPDQQHSIFTGDENNRFRAVHDAFGHVATGRNFSRHGEEAAFQAHSSMVRPEALDALRSETQMQNSYLNYTGGTFPDNKPFETPASKTGSLKRKPGDQLSMF